MTDHAPLVAAHLIERLAAGVEPSAVWVEMRERWPSLTVEDADRAAQMAEEVLAALIAEDETGSAVAEAELTE